MIEVNRAQRGAAACLAGLVILVVVVSIRSITVEPQMIRLDRWAACASCGYHDMFLPESLWWGTNPRMVDDQRHGGRVNGLFFDGHVYRPLIRAVTISFFTPYLDPTDPNNRPPT